MSLFKKKVEFVDWPDWQKKINQLDEFYFKQMVRRQSLANSFFRHNSPMIAQRNQGLTTRKITEGCVGFNDNNFYHPPQEDVFGISPPNPNPNYTIPTKNNDSRCTNANLDSGVRNNSPWPPMSFGVLNDVPKIKKVIFTFTDGSVKGYDYVDFKRRFRIMLKNRAIS
jgi:hypothetical protein